MPQNKSFARRSRPYKYFVIHVISTTANIDPARKTQYLNGLACIVSHYQCRPYIIETVLATDYLSEQFVGHSLHSPNKGINEFINIDLFLKQFDHLFHEEDTIIKTTLRYEIESSCLIDCIKEGLHDIYCKPSTDIYGPHDQGIHTFLIAMKYKCWKEFLASFDRNVDKDNPIEWQMANYVKSRNVKYLDRLGILASPDNLKKTYSV